MATLFPITLGREARWDTCAALACDGPDFACRANAKAKGKCRLNEMALSTNKHPQSPPIATSNPFRRVPSGNIWSTETNGQTNTLMKTRDNCRETQQCTNPPARQEASRASLGKTKAKVGQNATLNNYVWFDSDIVQHTQAAPAHVQRPQMHRASVSIRANGPAAWCATRPHASRTPSG